MNIPGLRGLHPAKILVKSTKDFFADDMSTYAAALAYRVLFAIFPFAVFLVALLGFLNVPEFFDWLLAQARLLLPPQAISQVNQVIAQVRDQSHGGLLSFGIVVAVWVASVGVRATMNAMNVAYDVAESRPLWKLYPLSILYTLALAALLLVAVALMVIGPQVVTWLADQIGIGQLVVQLWLWLRWPVAVLLLMIAVALIYYVAPNIDQPFRFITPGAVLAVLAWIAASLGFSAYISRFADYSATYGSIGTVIVLLLYFYISAAVLLFGAEVNATIEHAALEEAPAAEPAPAQAAQRLS